MKWFYNFKISVKLLAGFILVAIIAGIVGIVGITNIQKTDSKYGELYLNYGVTQGILGDAGISYQRIRVNLRDLIIDKGNTNRSQYTDKIKNYDIEINEDLAKYEKTISSEEDRNNFKALTDFRTKFAPLQQKIILFEHNPRV